MTDDAPAWERIDSLHWDELKRQTQAPIDAIATPYPSWNKACRDEGGGVGVAKGWMCVFAARQKEGKSTTALNICANAVRDGRRVGVLTYEMSRRQLLARFLAIYTGANLRRLEPGPDFDNTTWQEAIDVMSTAKGSLWIVERPDQNINQYREMLGMALAEDIDLCMVDYAQRIGIEHDSLYTRMLQVSNETQRAAHDGMAMLMLSQFNRSGTTGKDSPESSQLMGGALEADADQTILIDHSKSQRSMMTGTTEFVLDLNRHGPPMRWSVNVDYRNLRVSESQTIPTGKPKPQDTTKEKEAWFNR